MAVWHFEGQTALRLSVPIATAGFLILNAVIMLCAVGLGPVTIDPASVLTVLLEGPTPATATADSKIIWSLRLPRFLLGASVGFALATSGAALQGLFRNPLADPYVLGIASGAAFGAALALWLVPEGASVALWMPIAAFAGASIAGLSLYFLAQQGGRVTLSGLLLGGVAIALVFSALLSFILVIDANDAGVLIHWLLGHLGGASWTEVSLCFVFMVVGCSALFWVRHDLDGLLLGEEGAAATGVDVQRTQTIVFIATSLLVAGAVAFAGLIGFVGLIVPHLVRLLTGPRHATLLPLSGLVGAAVLVGADVIARISLPVELPVGVVTGCLGGPFFLVLLRRSLNT